MVAHKKPLDGAYVTIQLRRAPSTSSAAGGLLHLTGECHVLLDKHFAGCCTRQRHCFLDFVLRLETLEVLRMEILIGLVLFGLVIMFLPYILAGVMIIGAGAVLVFGLAFAAVRAVQRKLFG